MWYVALNMLGFIMIKRVVEISGSVFVGLVMSGVDWCQDLGSVINSSIQRVVLSVGIR